MKKVSWLFLTLLIILNFLYLDHTLAFFGKDDKANEEKKERKKEEKAFEPDPKLAQRVKEAEDLKVAANWEALYEYISPQNRQNLTLDSFIDKFDQSPAKISTYAINHYEDGSTAGTGEAVAKEVAKDKQSVAQAVFVFLDYTLMPMPFVENLNFQNKHRWIKVEDNWYWDFEYEEKSPFEEEDFAKKMGFGLATPSKMGVHLEEARKYMMLGNDEKSVTEFEMAIYADSKNIWDKLPLKDQYFRKNILDQIKLNSPLLYIDLGRALYEQEMTGEALGQFEKAKQMEPKSGLIYTRVGDVYYDAGRYSDAMKEYDLAIRTDPEGSSISEAHIGCGRVYMKYRQYSQALQEFKRAFQLDPENTKLLGDLGDAEFSLGNLTVADDYYQRAAKLSELPVEPKAKKDVFSWPYSSRQFETVKKGEIRKAIQTVNEARSIEILDMARKFVSDGDYLAALKAYFWVIKSEVADLEVYLGVAECYQNLGLLRLAANNYFYALRSAQDSEWRIIEKAVAGLKEIIAADPENLDWKFYLALALEKGNRVNESIEVFEEILKIEPDHLGTQLFLMKLFYDLGEDTKSLAVRNNLLKKHQELNIFDFQEVGFENIDGELFSSLFSQKIFLDGWSFPVGVKQTEQIWSNSLKSSFLVYLPFKDNYVMMFSAVPLKSPHGQPQTIKVFLNDQKIDEFVIKNGSNNYSVFIPMEKFSPGVQVVNLEFAYLSRPSDLMKGNRDTRTLGVCFELLAFARMYGAVQKNQIGTTGVQPPLDISVFSASLNTGDYSEFHVGEASFSINSRGLNFLVIDPATGEVISSASFDAFLSLQAQRRLIDFVEAIPKGMIVAFSVEDDLTRSLPAEVASSLKGLGAPQAFLTKGAFSTAFIGVAGADTGTALTFQAALPTVVSVVKELPLECQVPYLSGIELFARDQIEKATEELGKAVALCHEEIVPLLPLENRYFSYAILPKLNLKSPAERLALANYYFDHQQHGIAEEQLSPVMHDFKESSAYRSLAAIYWHRPDLSLLDWLKKNSNHFWRAPDPLDLNFGTLEVRQCFLPGFSFDEFDVSGISFVWATQNKVGVIWSGIEAMDYELYLRMMPFPVSYIENQGVRIIVNGKEIDTLLLDPGWKEYNVAIPKEVLEPEINVFEFVFKYTAVPVKITNLEDTRTLAAAFDKLRLVPRFQDAKKDAQDSAN